jgi:hypothetical protein
MAGGVKKPVNIFRLKNLPEPRKVFNWRLWLAVFSFGLMGAVSVSMKALLAVLSARKTSRTISITTAIASRSRLT